MIVTQGNIAMQKKGSNRGKVDLTSDEAKKRGWANLKPIQPGQALNPGGRPAMSPEVKAALEGATLPAVRKQIELMSCGDVRVELLASQAILDRFYGKAAQAVDKTVTVTSVQQQHLSILMELQAKRDQAMKAIEAIDATAIEKKDEEGA